MNISEETEVRTVEGYDANIMMRIAGILILAICLATECFAADKHLPLPHATTQTIRTITIEVADVFDDGNLSWFYRGVNSAKVNTQEHVVRRELLFKEGDPFDPFLIEESERNLRSLPFLRKIAITPVSEGEFVDVLVRVQDTWTLLPFFSFTSGGGSKKQSVGIAETNLLGFGKRLEALYADDDGREKIETVYDDRRLFGTRTQLTQGVFKRSDGYRAVGYFGRPFRSLLEPNAWSVDTDFYDLVGQLYENGDERFIYREKREAMSVGYTVARGVPDEEVRRYTLGYDFSSSKFSEADEDDFEDVDVDPDSVSRDPGLLADDRKFSGPFIGLQKIETDFISMNFLDRFDRVEDYNLGSELLARLTFASDALGSYRDTLLFNVSQADGWRLGGNEFLRGKVGVVSRANTEKFENSIFSLDLRYYNVLGAKFIGDFFVGKHTLVASFAGDFGVGLDKDREFLLGAGTGLRGYEDRTFTGSQSLLLNLEDRMHFVEDVYKLISLGGAVFFDVGGTSDRGWGDIVDDELRSDIGFGLRFGFPRSSGGSVLRVDLAFSLRDGPDGTNAFEPRLLITSGQAVSARLPAESQQNQGSNVTVKFIP